MCLGDGVDAVGHIARGGIGRLYQIAARVARDRLAPGRAGLIFDLHSIPLRVLRGDGRIASRIIFGGRVTEVEQRAGLRGNCGSIAGRVTNSDLQRDAALVVVLLRTDDHGVETLFVGIVDLLDLRVGVQIVEHVVGRDLVAGLIDHVDRVRRELLACLERHIGRGNAVNLAAADVDVLRVRGFIPHVVVRVIAEKVDRGDGELVLARVRLFKRRSGRHSVDAVAVDDADIVGRQTRAVRGLIGHGVVQHDLNDVDIGGAVVDLGLRDGVRNGDAALLDSEGLLNALLRPVGGSGERDHGLVGTGLCRLDRVAIRVLIADGPRLVRSLIDARALEVEAIERDFKALRAAVVGRIRVADFDVVAALADDQAAGDLLRRVTGVGCGADRQGVEAGGDTGGVPIEGVPAVDSVFVAKDLLVLTSGAIALRVVVRDRDGDVRVRHCADHAGQIDIRGDGLALGDALGVLSADLAGVERDGDSHAGVRRHQNIGVVDLTAVVRICRTDHALVKLPKGALGDRLVVHRDDRAIGSVLLDLVKNEGRAGLAVDIRPVLGVCKVCAFGIANGGRAVQFLPLDGVVSSRIQLGDGVEQIASQLTIQRVDIAQCKRGLFIGLECAVAHADVDALVTIGRLLLVLVVAVEDHRGVDGDGVVGRRAASGSRDGLLGFIHRGADIKRRVTAVDGGDLHVLLGVVISLDRQLIGLNAGGHNACDLCKVFGFTNLCPISAINAVVEGHSAGGLHRGIGTLGRGYRCRQGDLIELIDVGRSSRLDGVGGLHGHGDVLLGADDGILRGRLAAREHALTGQLDAVAVVDLGGRGGIGYRRAVVVGLGKVTVGLILPLDVVVLCRNGTAVERDHGPIASGSFRTGLTQLEFVLHARQQADQVVLIARAIRDRAIQRARQRRLDDRGHELCGLDVDGLGIGLAGFIGFISLVHCVELIEVLSCILRGVPCGDFDLEGSNAVYINGNQRRIQERVVRAVHMTVELHVAGLNAGAAVLSDLGRQGDGLTLELRLVLADGGKGRIAVDLDILGLFRCVDRQRGGGGLKDAPYRIGVEEFVVSVVDNTIFVELCRLGIEVTDGNDLCAVLMSGVFRRDLILVGIGDLCRHIGPITCDGVLILPDDGVVLAELGGVVRSDSLKAEDLGNVDRQLVGLPCGHGARRFRDCQSVRVLSVQRPRDGLGEHADVHDIGLLAVGIALVGLGFEDGPVMLSHAAGLVIADLHAELCGLAVDRGRADARTVSALLVALVEHDGALGVDVQRRLKRNALALVLDDAVVLLRIVGHIRDLQCQLGILRKPNSVQGGVRGELCGAAGIDNNAGFGVDGLRVPIYGDGCFAVCAPAHEFIARAPRLLRGNGVVLAALEIILHDLRGRQTGHVIARIRVVRDRDRLADNAGNGDVGVLRHRGEAEVDSRCAVIAHFRIAVGSECVAVRGNRYAVVVLVAVFHDQIERDGRAVGHLKTVVGQSCSGIANFPVRQFPAVAAQRVHGDDREDGRDLGIDGQLTGDGLGKVVGLMGRRRRMVCATPADEPVTLDVRLLGLCRRVTELDGLRHEGLGIPHIICQFLTVRVHNAIDKLDIRTRIFGDLDRHDLIGRHVLNFIGIGRGLVFGIEITIGFCQCAIRRAADGNHRLGRRICAVHGHGEGEVTAVLHDEGLTAADGVAAAALKGDGVGLLRPDSVERHVIRELFGHGRARGVDHKTLIFFLGPAEEVIAIAGRRDRAQRDRLTVGFGGGINGVRRDSRAGRRIQIIVD